MAAETSRSPSPGLEFCRVGPAHADGLAALLAALQENGDSRHFHPHPLTADEARRISAYDGADLYYVAKAGSEVLAYGMLRGWDSGFDTPSLGIAVRPGQRGSGLGHAFMLFLHAAARARGAPRIRLKVYPDNLSALRLYTGLGYTVVGEESGQLVASVELEPAARVRPE